jgi:hypothetical protein
MTPEQMDDLRRHITDRASLADALAMGYRLDVGDPHWILSTPAGIPYASVDRAMAEGMLFSVLRAERARAIAETERRHTLMLAALLTVTGGEIVITDDQLTRTDLDDLIIERDDIWNGTRFRLR